MKPILLLLISITLSLIGYSQDSTYYSVLWSPKNLYRKAAISQEGIFIVRCRNSVVVDSFLWQTKLYDSLGQVTRLEDYQATKLRTRFTYFYSGTSLASMLQEEVWLPAKMMHHYTCDENGNILIDQTFNGEKKTVQKRSVYNNFNQPIQVYIQAENEPEYLSKRYNYRSDHLVQQIDYYYSKAEAIENFSYVYTYSKDNKTTTRFFQRMSGNQRFIDCIRTYNEKDQLITKINAPFPKNSWLPPNFHTRDEEIETTLYLPNGMVAERQTKVNDQVVLIERHLYF